MLTSNVRICSHSTFMKLECVIFGRSKVYCTPFMCRYFVPEYRLFSTNQLHSCICFFCCHQQYCCPIKLIIAFAHDKIELKIQFADGKSLDYCAPKKIVDDLNFQLVVFRVQIIKSICSAICS